MERSTWDQTWWNVAMEIGDRSRCDGRQIGAVIVTAMNRPVSVGYNGPPAGFDTSEGPTCQSFCPRRKTGLQTHDYNNCISVHAEANALMFADRRDYEGGTLYVTSVPCWDCGKMVANSGLKRVVTRVTSEDGHRDPAKTLQLLKDCGLYVVEL